MKNCDEANASRVRAQHTPGPWAYEPSSGAIYRDDGDVEPLIASTNLECVSVEQGDADGRLIAAAPDLLAVVQQMVEQCQPGTGHSMPDVLVGQALLAVAKAKGGDA